MKTHKLLDLSSTNKILFVGISNDCESIKQKLIDSKQFPEISLGLRYLEADELVNFNKDDMNLPKGYPIEDFAFAFLYPESRQIYDHQNEHMLNDTFKEISKNLVKERQNQKFEKFYQQNSFRKPSNS